MQQKDVETVAVVGVLALLALVVVVQPKCPRHQYREQGYYCQALHYQCGGPPVAVIGGSYAGYRG